MEQELINTITNMLFGADCYSAWIGMASLALSALGTAVSGISSAVINKKQEQNLANEKARQNAWYDREMYQDPLTRSDNAQILKALDDRLRHQTEVEDSKGAVLNSTPEARLAARQQNNDTMAQVISGMAAQSSQRRDALSAQRNQMNQQYNNAQMELDASRMQNAANLATNAVNLGSAGISAMGEGELKRLMGKKKNV